MAPNIIQTLKAQAAKRPATIVYPEPEDGRIVEAARRVLQEGIARPILVGRPDCLPADLPNGIASVAVQEGEQMARLAEAYAARRGVALGLARRMLSRPLVFAAMMVSEGQADGMVAGASHATASLLQAAGLAIGYQEGVLCPSSFFIMVVPRLRGQAQVPLIFADCAVNIEPTAEQLASIAVASARSARRFLEVTPRVAMLSFSTHGSASHAKVDLVRRATELARASLEDGFVEGELQLDAAVVPEVAARKVKGPSEVAGQANVLIFPDLNAGNIAYKAVQHLGGAQAVGPILQGFRKPVNDLSRGATVEDIVATTAVTVLQA